MEQTQIKIVKVNQDLKNRLQEYAKEDGISLSDYLKLELGKIDDERITGRHSNVFLAPINDLAEQINRNTNMQNHNTEIMVTAIRNVSDNMRILIKWLE